MSTPSRRASRPQGPPDATRAPITAPEPQHLVPEVEVPAAHPRIRPLGRGFRWYDPPYVVLRLLIRSKASGWLSPLSRANIRRGLNAIFQTHHARELRSGSRTRSWDVVQIPDTEKVDVPAVWVAEYFTASNVHRLYDAIRRSDWNSPRFSQDVAGTAELASSRSGRGRIWWRIAEFRSWGSGKDVHRSALPRGVEDISIIGVPIGTGVTAVVVTFTLDSTFSDQLNVTLRANHQAAVIRRAGQMPVAQGPKAVLHHQLQLERAKMHTAMRRWVTRSLPGIFALSGKPQPLFDLIFFDAADPSSETAERAHQQNDALRGMGVDGMMGYQVTSGELPGLRLELADESWAPNIGANVWSLWGNSASVVPLAEHTGNPDSRGAAFNVGERTTDFMARSGLTALLGLLQENASLAHDNARRLHGGSSSRDLKRLRERTLTTSLDLATLEEDIRKYNGRRWRDQEPQFLMNLLPTLRTGESATDHPPIDINRSDRKRQKRLARELVRFDADYREVLSTVASLGATLDSRRVQRVAVWVSVASLGVAVVTLWATSDPRPDVVQVVADVIGSWFA